MMIYYCCNFVGKNPAEAAMMELNEQKKNVVIDKTETTVVNNT